MSYIGRVEPEDIQRGLEDMRTLVADLAPGFRILVDFSRLDSMSLDCVPYLGQGMEIIDKRGVSLIVRVIPDPSKTSA
ncbi:MAG: hypothetical protein WDM76_08800 [Limisphaerales bacterium]